MMRFACLAVLTALFTAPSFARDHSADENTVWSLEDAYWRYVQSNDLEHYRDLWHRDFLGWPMSNPEPVHKDHITDWIEMHLSRGETLQSYDVERLAAQAARNYLTVAYRVRMIWVTKDGAGKPSASRVVHSWMPVAGGKWQIISGMAASADAQGH